MGPRELSEPSEILLLGWATYPTDWARQVLLGKVRGLQLT